MRTEATQLLQPAKASSAQQATISKFSVFATYDEVDIEYYVSKQVVPAAARVLSSFNITEEQLLGSKLKGTESRKLTDFFDG